jgi:uncharacterized membrane protein YgaE (UPF0421/DUF939 family)
VSTKFALPGWIAVLGPAAITVGGLALGGVYFPIAIAVSCVLAALVVERSAFFAVAVQPPLITAIVVTGAVFLGESLLDGAAQLAETFPYLIGTTVAVIVILLVRSRLQARAKQRHTAADHELVAAQAG